MKNGNAPSRALAVSATEVSSVFFGASRGFFHKVDVVLRAGLRTVQTARMMSALAQMSDEQLSQIGITRADIPNYTDKIMATEYPTAKNSE